MKTHGCPHIYSCSSCLLPSAFLVSSSILFYLLYLPPRPSTPSFSTFLHKNSLKMSTSDVSSVYSPEQTHQQRVSETDLTLCLSLSSSANMGMNSGKDHLRVSGNETLGLVPSTAESSEMGINGGWFNGRMKRVNRETIGGGEEERKRRVVSLQPREPSCEHVQENIYSSPRSHTVGWPPLQTCRKNAVCIQQRSPHHEHVEEATCANSVMECKRSSNFVKVVMDGMPIGRKVDLNAHDSYNSLAITLENMFHLPHFLKGKDSSSRQWHLSDYLLTYVDKDGDWMLLGDAPWENFVKSVKRLRISYSSMNESSSSHLVGGIQCKKMNYITRQLVDFVNSQSL